MLRPRRNWTRGVAAQHASLSRWRSPVRIRSGPPSSHFPTPRPPARTGRSSARRSAAVRPVRRTSVTLPPVKRPRSRRARPRPRRRSWRRWPRASSASAAAADRRQSPGPTSTAVDRAPRPSAATPATGDARRGRPPTPRRRARHADARRPAEIADVADRAGHELPLDGARRPARRSVDGRAGRHEHALRRRSSSSTARPTRSSPRSASTGRPIADRLVLAADAATLATDLAKTPQAARVPARRRGRAGGSGAGLGRRRRCSASIASRTSPTGRSTRPPARRRPRPTPSTRRRPGPCSPAATSCSTAAST